MSDEVSNFLRSVEQLNSRRDEDEEARSRELEEKILQQRRERQARREGTYKYILRQALARIADLAFRCSRPVSRVEADLCLPARPPYPEHQLRQGALEAWPLLPWPVGGLETVYTQLGLASFAVFLFLA